VIRLSREAEPKSSAHRALRHGSRERGLRSRTGALDLDDDRHTETPAPPIRSTSFARSDSGRAPHPTNVIMLTADAFGVMPPIASCRQARRCIISCPASPPGSPARKSMGSQPGADVLHLFRCALHAASSFGVRQSAARSDRQIRLRLLAGEHRLDRRAGDKRGKRMPIKLTRALLAAVLDGSLAGSEWRVDPVFGFRTPVKVAGVATAILNPRDTWKDKAAFDAQAKKLAGMFRDNFKKYIAHVDERVLKNADQIAKRRGRTSRANASAPRLPRRSGSIATAYARAGREGGERSAERVNNDALRRYC